MSPTITLRCTLLSNRGALPIRSSKTRRICSRPTMGSPDAGTKAAPGYTMRSPLRHHPYSRSLRIGWASLQACEPTSRYSSPFAVGQGSCSMLRRRAPSSCDSVVPIAYASGHASLLLPLYARKLASTCHWEAPGSRNQRAFLSSTVGPWRAAPAGFGR